MKRIMGVDYGDARTGIAVSDLLCSIVGTTTVIHSRNAEKTIAQICTMVKDSDVGEIVVGLPKNMDGTEGARAELCRAFAQQLEQATGLPVHLWDERRNSSRIPVNNRRKPKNFLIMWVSTLVLIAANRAAAIQPHITAG